MQGVDNKLPHFHPTLFYVSLIILFIFGFFYNLYVAKLEKEGRERGKTSLLVVFGTLITLIPVRLQLGRQMFWRRIFPLFCASGSWMVAGSIYRYLQELSDVEQANKNLSRSIDKLFDA
jgi:formate-dependent nitrite reductase membrane component NrfD